MHVKACKRGVKGHKGMDTDGINACKHKTHLKGENFSFDHGRTD